MPTLKCNPAQDCGKRAGFPLRPTVRRGRQEMATASIERVSPDERCNTPCGDPRSPRPERFGGQSESTRFSSRLQGDQDAPRSHPVSSGRSQASTMGKCPPAMNADSVLSTLDPNARSNRGTGQNLDRTPSGAKAVQTSGSKPHPEEGRSCRDLAAHSMGKYPATMNDDSVLSPLDPNGAAQRRPDDGDEAFLWDSLPGGKTTWVRSCDQSADRSRLHPPKRTAPVAGHRQACLAGSQPSSHHLRINP